jgi:DNA-binding LacI/PurR family transcriptional regulator
MSVTRDDVAKLAGVSTTTISYVINNGPRPVSRETREKVLKAIEQLGYQPNVIARSLKTNKTNTAGIIISDILNPTLASIEKSIEDLLLPQNYSLTVCNSDESPDRERMWLGMLRGKRMDGVILLPTGSNRPLLFSIVESGQQIVLIDRLIDGLHTDAVLFDNEMGSYLAVKHLIDRGHKVIGLLNLPNNFNPGLGRLRGYEKALSDAGIPSLSKYIVEGSFKAQEGQAVIEKLLEQSPRPTALLVSSNRLAQSALKEIKSREMKMPDDIALCVFDDVAYYSFFTPTISAVSCDFQEFGVKAVQFLIERINGTYKGEPRTALIPCYLNIRESSQ